MSRIGRFLFRHRWLLRLTPRWLRDRAVWAAVLATPGTQEALDRGLTDHAAGRFYLWNDGDIIPNPDWPTDGPQPDLTRPGPTEREPGG